MQEEEGTWVAVREDEGDGEDGSESGGRELRGIGSPRESM